MAINNLLDFNRTIPNKHTMITTVNVKLKGDEVQVFVNGKEVATVELASTKREEAKVGATPGAQLSDLEYTGPKHSRKELEELLGPAFVRQHEEHLKSRMK
jgi:hypothetical protein